MAPYRVRFARNARSIFPSGRQFITSVFVSQPLRATPIPNHKSRKRSVRWASGLITHFTPFSLASGHQRQSRSSRFGAALSSTQMPVSAASSRIAGMSILYGSRFTSWRPVALHSTPYSCKQAKAIGLFVQLAYRVDLRLQFRFIEAVGLDGTPAVFGDSKIFEAQRLRGFRHFFERVVPVTRCRVTM